MKGKNGEHRGLPIIEVPGAVNQNTLGEPVHLWKCHKQRLSKVDKSYFKTDSAIECDTDLGCSSHYTAMSKSQ